MPTYEKVNADGDVVERTVTLPAGHPTGYDEQMAALAADDATPWRPADDFPPEAHSDPNPTLPTAMSQSPSDRSPEAYSAAVAAANLKTEEA